MMRLLLLLAALVAFALSQPPTPTPTTEGPQGNEKPDDSEDEPGRPGGASGPPRPPSGRPGSPSGRPGPPSGDSEPPPFIPGILPPYPRPPGPEPSQGPPPKPSKYFLLAPRTVRPGMALELTAMFKDFSGDVTVIAEIGSNVYNRTSRKSDYHQIASNTAVFSPMAKGTITIQVPQDIPQNFYSFVLRVRGSGGLTFEHENTLSIRRKTLSIFIQTDKSQYKPGQTVRMRAFAVDPNLKPYYGGLEIKIQDKANNIIKHWKDQKSDSGVITKELALSDQPVMGTWRIEVKAMGESVRKEFDVKEYVLPKVEVEVDVKEYVDEDEESLSGTIRAKYTYGQPVEGPVNITILSANTPYVPRGVKRTPPKTYKIMGQLKDGKVDFSVKLEDVKALIERPYYYPKDAEWKPSLSYQRFIVNATVRDKLTDIPYQSEQMVNFRRSIYSISVVHAPSNYKPGAQYFAMVQVKNLNGGGLTDQDLTRDGEAEPLQVVTRYRDCYDYNSQYDHVVARNYSLAQDGFLRFQVDVLDGCETFQPEIRFRDAITYASSVGEFKTRYKTGALTLSLDNLRQQIMPGDEVAVNVKFADNPTEYTYYIISKGVVVEWETLPATQRRFTFRATTRMAPSAKIVAWYTTERLEIISDSLSISLGDMFENQVSLSFSTNETRPAGQLSLDVTAAPRSYVALLAVDKSVLLMEDTHDITKQAVEKEMRQYESGLPFFPGLYFRMWWPMPIGGDDPTSIFRNADCVVMTDGYIYEYVYRWAGGPGLFSPRGAAGAAGPGGPVAERGPVASPGARSAPAGPSGGSPDLAEPTRVRSVFPETWIWADEVTDADGRTSLQLTAPDTITSWVASAFAMNSEKGLGVAADRSKMTVFKPFFVSLNLPYSVIRNEEFALQVLVYNYMETEQKALVTLMQSFEFSVRKGGPDLPREEARNQQLSQEVTIPAGEAKSVYFWIVPDTLGQVKLEVKAQTPMAADALRRSLLVEPEGVQKEETNTHFIELSDSGADTYNRRLEIDFPDNTIEGSERVTVTAVGDILSQSMDGLDRLIRMPYGCGEQNMVAFVPNIVALKYLNATGQANEKLQKQAHLYMETGYQRELTYKHPDGSYSAFGERDESGSLWLTAFVLKSFLQAKDYIFIDDNVVAQAAKWLVRQQKIKGEGRGSFIEPGRVLSSYMQGGSGKGAAMTAYTLIALSQDNIKVPGMEEELARAKRAAIDYLEWKLISSGYQPYTLAIVTYALHLAGSSRADEVFRLFETMAVEKANEGMRYWLTDKEEAQDDNWPYRYQAKASDVELNAYALLIYLHRGMLTESLPIAKWLLAQRNANGGFRSTQDTVIGLEALGELAAQLSTANQQNVQLSLESPAGVYYFQPITREKSLILQRADYPGKVTDITLNAIGKGVAIVQVAVQYNLEEDEMKPAVNMSVVAQSIKDRIRLSICSSWMKEGESGMMVTEIQMLTGYSQEETNKEMLERLKAKGVKRVENKDKNLVFYYDELTIDPICIGVVAKKTESVNKIKKAKIATYQYYSPDEQTIMMYSPRPQDSAQDECDVCPACCAAEQTAKVMPAGPSTEQ